MTASLCLPRLVFGSGSLSMLAEELALLGVRRPLLVSDSGIEHAGLVAAAEQAAPFFAARFLSVQTNPTLEDADKAFAAYEKSDCDGIVALGGGSVMDTAKFVAALAGNERAKAADLLGRPDRIGSNVAALIAVPTTIGTGSESSPVAGLHADHHSRAVGTRSQRLVPRVAICDPDLTRSLPALLVAATGIDALSHCIEGFFAEPAHPLADAFALEGIRRAFTSLPDAPGPEADAARTELMAAAFAGGVAIHKGLGPAHAFAIVCGDQGHHHGLLVAAALPLTLDLVASHAPAKARQVAAALGLKDVEQIGPALRDLNQRLGLPRTLRELAYQVRSVDELSDSMARSHFNKTSPYAPTQLEYRKIIVTLLS